MNLAKRVNLISAVVVSCVGCDQITKSIAKSVLPGAGPSSYLGDTVRLQLVHNRGAFLSLGTSLPEAWRQGLFLVGVGGMLLGILAYTLLSQPGGPSVVLALALLVGGGVGNLLDRIAYGGYVVDFINIGVGPVRTGIFNVADIAITVGALILAVSAWRERHHVR